MADDDVKVDQAAADAPAVDAEPTQSHLMRVAELRFAYSVEASEETKAAILAIVNEHKMDQFYQSLCAAFAWPEDAALTAAMRAHNEAAVVAADAKVADAEKNQGEMEVRDALLAKAELLAAAGAKDAALAAYEVALKKTVGAGPRIDVVFATLRVALFANDIKLLSAKLDEAKKLIDEGGDWDRRNRLKLYRALHCMFVRDFKTAASLLLDCVATFTATELFPYSQFVLYTIVASMVAESRTVIGAKIVKSPEVFGSIDEVPHLSALLHSLHACRYADFFSSLTAVFAAARTDRFLAPHARHLQRELRLVAYSQFLVSYKSVTLASMAAAFAISVPLLDSDLAQFIYAGRLSCKIDKVSGVVETTRPDARNAQYAAVIKDGDALLNRVQKLSRVISY